MSSPQKRSRRQARVSSSRLSEPALPLHIALAWLVIKVFPINDEREPVSTFSAGFSSSILKVIAREIFELSETSATFDDLLKETDTLVKQETASIARSNEKIRRRGQVVRNDRDGAGTFRSWLGTLSFNFSNVADGCAFLDSRIALEKDLRDRINNDDEALVELPEPIVRLDLLHLLPLTKAQERRSPFGVFLRGLLITLRKLSFDETAHLARQIALWCGVSVDGPSRPVHIWSLNRKVAMEDTLDKRVDAMLKYQAASSSGDYSGALASLRRFYDYQFPIAGRGQHQHALLNLASFHYSIEGLESARAAIDEAIRVARAEGDKSCLRECMSLSQRMTTETSAAAFGAFEARRIHQSPISASRVPKVSMPMDELWSIKAALDLGEPVHVAFRRVHLALARFEQTQIKSDDKKDPIDGWTAKCAFDISAWHAAQAGLWSALGSDTLAVLHEDMAMNAVDGDTENRLLVLLARAQRSVDKGEYSEALASLLDINVLQGMSMAEYHRWSTVVWSILQRQASMSGDTECMDMITALMPPRDSTSRLGPGGPIREVAHPTNLDSLKDPVRPRGMKLVQDEIRSSLREAKKMQESNAPPQLTMPHVLSAVQLSSELGLWPLYRHGIVVLGEVLLAMEGTGMAKKAFDEVESVWPQILASGDEETIALGALVQGKAKVEISLNGDIPDLLGEAADYLQQSLRAATKLGSRTLTMQATTLLALISDIQGGSESDQLAQQWQGARIGEAEELSKRKDQTRRVGEVVKLVGVRVAEGWR